MSSTPPHRTSLGVDAVTSGGRRTIWLAVSVLGVVTFAVYANSLHGPFVFDDVLSIARNASIRRLSDLGAVLSPSADSTVGGRPVSNLSFALNHAWGGESVFGYHLVNVLLHTLSTLVLFGGLRRILDRVRPGDDAAAGRDAVPVAFAGALLWAVHPVLTATVSYISQRTEVLMGLFYLLTLYTFFRGATERKPAWLTTSVVACALGMGSKEVMVTAPMMAFLLDRTLVAGSFREAWRQRWGYYLCLGATWALLAVLMSTGLEHRGVGQGLGVSSKIYALTEARAIVTYLRLAVWPAPLIFDYGAIFDAEWSAVAPHLALVVVLLALTGYLLWKRAVIGLMAAWFFVTLAPTSSIVPVAGQPIAENRLYLPLVAVAVGLAVGAHRLLGRRSWAGLAAVALLFAGLTVHRNETFRSNLALLADTVAKRPQNSRAQNNYSVALLEEGRNDDALRHAQAALAISPNYPEAMITAGRALAALGRPGEALAWFEKAHRLKPGVGQAWADYGDALLKTGRVAEALPWLEKAALATPEQALVFVALGQARMSLGQAEAALGPLREAVRLAPNQAAAFAALGNALFGLGRHAEAEPHLARALQLLPRSAVAHNDYANVLDELGRAEEAASHYRSAFELQPMYPEAHYNYGDSLLRRGRAAEAEAQFSEALRERPDYAEAHNSAGACLQQLGREAEALGHFLRAAELQPANVQARSNAGLGLLRVGRWVEAAAHFDGALRARPGMPEALFYGGYALARAGQAAEAQARLAQAVQARPDWPEARNLYGEVLLQAGRRPEAAAQFEAALRLKPDYAEARRNLALARP